METKCPKCGGQMLPGTTTARGLWDDRVMPRDEPSLLFIVPGTPTSPNPIKAFAQGLADEPADRALPIVGLRCSNCGFLELYAKG